jgi:hypothetical protein
LADLLNSERNMMSAAKILSLIQEKQQIDKKKQNTGCMYREKKQNTGCMYREKKPNTFVPVHSLFIKIIL